ncbi:MAG: xanthine dehydrogenase accessory factor [Acidobacteriota bacterium]|nr:xanthine dehydrogenase accessory factor [Acidobacteriota bacterium]
MDSSSVQNSSAQLTHAVARILEEGALAVLATVVEAGNGVGAKILLEETGGRTGTTGDAALDEALAVHAPLFLATRVEARTLCVEEFAPALEAWRTARVLFERVEPEPRVVVCGAGHVGAALARLAHAVGYRVTLLDDREDFVARSRFPAQDIELIAASDWTRSLAASIGTGRGVYVAVVTRGHNEDEECMRAVLSVRPDYVGMIGSRRRTNIVLGRLRETGFKEEQLRQVRAPVGLDIGAVSPEEVALSILAEIVAHRRGGTGQPLSVWRRA